MAPHKVLEYMESVMVRLGLSSNNLTEAESGFFRKPVAYYYMLFCMFGFISAGFFVYKDWPQMELIATPCCMVVVGIQAGGMLLSFGHSLPRIKSVHHNLQAIVNELTGNHRIKDYCLTTF